MKIAVLGMGHMGQALAGRLLGHGHDLVIWNRTPGKAPELVGKGATEAATVADAISAADVILTSLSNDQAVRETACGQGGVLASAPAQAVYVDTSTISPALCQELADLCVRFVAMPVLGSPDAVASGQAVYLVGGPPSAVALLEPLLALLSQRHLVYDRAALASTAKLSCNLLLLNAVAALAECFATGRAGGLSDDQLRQLLAESPLVAPAVRNRFEGVLTGNQTPWWPANLGVKDAGLATDLAGQAGHDLCLTKTAQDMYRRAGDGPGSEDIAAVGNLYR